MKGKAVCGFIVLAIGLLSPGNIQAQGTTYLSNLDQPSAGSQAVGSDSWLATDFFTGDNTAGYALDSIQLGMADASGTPGSFSVMISSASFGIAIFPGSNLGTLQGSSSPVTGGNYTYTPAASIMLSPSTDYFIVLTAGTSVADGAFDWSYAGANSYNGTGGWSSRGGSFFISSDGSLWGRGSVVGPQYAISATPIPEPGVLSLLGLGGLAFGWQRRKVRPVR